LAPASVRDSMRSCGPAKLRLNTRAPSPAAQSSAARIWKVVPLAEAGPTLPEKARAASKPRSRRDALQLRLRHDRRRHRRAMGMGRDVAAQRVKAAGDTPCNSG
jgi:hypothetical protein